MAAVVLPLVQLAPPSSDRSTRNPASVLELSLHVTLTVLPLVGTLLVADGALGTGGGDVVAQAVLAKSEYLVFLLSVLNARTR